jgi:hypothetical protein
LWLQHGWCVGQRFSDDFDRFSVALSRRIQAWASSTVCAYPLRSTDTALKATAHRSNDNCFFEDHPTYACRIVRRRCAVDHPVDS